MDQRIEELLAAARSGEQKDFLALVRALRQGTKIDAQAIVDFCRSDEPILRRAAVELGTKREEPMVLEALAQLVDDREEAVRDALAVAVADADWWQNDAVVEMLLDDRSDSVRLHAAQACKTRLARPVPPCYAHWATIGIGECVKPRPRISNCTIRIRWLRRC